MYVYVVEKIKPASQAYGFTEVGSTVRPEPNLKNMHMKCYGLNVCVPPPPTPSSYVET